MTEKQQQLTFDKGITNVPSDALCSDNSLAESIGLIYDNGEHRVIQKPAAYTPTAMVSSNEAELIFIHRINGVLRHILRVAGTEQNPDDTLYYKIDDNTPPVSFGTIETGEIKAEAIGNTLILNGSSGLQYYLWDYQQSTYRFLGNKIPDIPIRFTVTEAKVLGFENGNIETDVPDEYADPNKYNVIPGVEGKVIGLMPTGETIDPLEEIAGNFWIENNGHEEGKTGLIGLVASRLNYVKQMKRFAFPFWARSAVRLYDGSHINISNPFLLLPTVFNNWEIFACVPESPYTPRVMGAGSGGWPMTNYLPYCSRLKYYPIIPSGLDDWADIISGVDIFVSEEVKSFDMESPWLILNCALSKEQDPNTDAVTTADTCSPLYGIKRTIRKYYYTDRDTWNTYYKPSLLTEAEITKRLVEKSVFYKILELDRETDLSQDKSGILVDSTTKIDRYALVNLTTQTQLENDDYFSRVDMVPNIIKAYNSRLHMADVKRGFFAGFTRFSYTAYDQTANSYRYDVHIKSEEGEKVVGAIGTTYDIFNVWFFYPDPRAYQVDVYKVTGISPYYTYYLLATLPLKEHPYLNGSYYFGHLPTSSEERPSVSTSTTPATLTDSKELLEDQVLVSEVNNPWLFKAEGYVNVGMGRIRGIASQTVALGQEEHGIHPLIVFSERGISTLRLNNEGVYIRSDELSREVCNNPASITETDGAVFFVSKKGLMVIVGNQVKCVSEQLSGRSDTTSILSQTIANYSTFFNRCFIAYDYRDSLLWLFDGQSQYGLVYSIKSGTFGKYNFGVRTVGTTEVPIVVKKAINDYPDYLLQTDVPGQLLSLIYRPDINYDGSNVTMQVDNEDVTRFVYNTYSAKMLTRPMKLENAFALKSVMEIRNIGNLSTGCDIALSIYASNNLKDWVQLTSLRGIPWLYYRFLYEFTSLKAIDRFAGSMIITQERRTNKLRAGISLYEASTDPAPTPETPVQPAPDNEIPPTEEPDPSASPVRPTPPSPEVDPSPYDPYDPGPDPQPYDDDSKLAAVALACSGTYQPTATEQVNHHGVVGSGSITFRITNNGSQRILYNGRFLFATKDGTKYKAYFREPSNLNNGEHWYYCAESNYVLEIGDTIEIVAPLERTNLGYPPTQTISTSKLLETDASKYAYTLYFSHTSSDRYLHNAEMDIIDTGSLVVKDANEQVIPSTDPDWAKITPTRIYELEIRTKTTNYALGAGVDKTAPKTYVLHISGNERVLVPLRLNDWLDENEEET